MKAREIRERLKGKLDFEVLYVLEELVEQNNVLHEQMLTLAQYVDQVINITTDLTDVAANMKQQSITDQIKGKNHGTDEFDN